MEIKINDVFKFRYSEEYIRQNPNRNLYHCFDGILKVCKSNSGKLRLYDGYWSSDNENFSLEEALSRGTLKFICNLDDVEQVKEHECLYYNEKDIFVLPYHSGYNTIFLKRKGAEKCRETIIKQLKAKIQKAESNLESAKRELELAEVIYEKSLKEEDVNKIYL